ncbi:hypothetical protein [Oricola thermophila]|uniref:Uncharacterized protein n=1 Tax=Oricola thermophila TaxID=2742145 RepID=A0A6N1VBB0_9HYPH|nr:hypothetical protein [Oricola thermophila]QKV18256.1 hypothetical protein HTY61_07195 [Oricola thermophila]
MFQKIAVFQPYSVFDYVEDPAMCERGKAFIYDMLEQGRIRPQIDPSIRRRRMSRRGTI